MSNTVLVNDSLVEITGMLKNGTWETVDLSSFLSHDDPKIVVIHMINTHTVSVRVSGIKPVGSAMPDARSKKTMQTTQTRQAPCSLAGGTSIQLFANNSEVDFYIHAELGGDDVIAYDDPTSLGTVTPNAWRTVDATTRLGSDAGQVSAVVLWLDWNNAGDWGYREFGSVDNWHPNNTSASSTFGICRIDRVDRYQIYQSRSGGKSPTWEVWIYEVGFIRRNWYHITDPVDRALNTTGAWTDEDLTDITEDVAEIALIRMWNAAGSNDGWARNDGGSQIEQRFRPNEARHILVNLTASQVYEYWIDVVTMDQYIMGWFANPTNVLNLDTGTLNLDTGTLNIG